MIHPNNIRCAVIGYGGAFNMGRAHAEFITRTEGLQLSAVCDLSPERTAVAATDFPHVATFNSIETLLASGTADLCVVVLPHNLHAPIAIQCLEAGKHVVVEKPMCLTVDEATRMIEASRRAGKMLSVFHNRRQDSDYQTLWATIVDQKVLGEVFSVEAFSGGWEAPNPREWRSVKAVSGGAFYDWGAHVLDWILGIIPGKITDVSGYFHKRIWHEVTNEDQVQALIRFENGCVVNIIMSSIAHAGKPRWWILGEKGALVDHGGSHQDGFYEISALPDGGAPSRVPYNAEIRWANFYGNIAGHLLRDEALEVRPEQARRIVAIIEAAEKSSQLGHSVSLPTEDEDAQWPRFA